MPHSAWARQTHPLVAQSQLARFDGKFIVQIGRHTSTIFETSLHGLVGGELFILK